MRFLGLCAYWEAGYVHGVRGLPGELRRFWRYTFGTVAEKARFLLVVTREKGARERLLRVRRIDVTVLGAMVTEMREGGGGRRDMRLFAAEYTRRGDAARGLCLGENRCDGVV